MEESVPGYSSPAGVHSVASWHCVREAQSLFFPPGLQLRRPFPLAADTLICHFEASSKTEMPVTNW